MPTYAFMCERCKKSFEGAHRRGAGGREGGMPDLWRRTGHTPDGDLYRKDLTKELRITDDTL